MEIWCAVCSKKQASVFCSADEAALCDDCDQRVHQANKLANKHHRFSLLQPSSSSHLPHCDICQEKKALLFCQEDRAILCRDCDVPLHTSNEHTQKHNRFLLTGAKLSVLSSSTTTTKNKAKSDSAKSGFDQVPDIRSKSLTTKRPYLSSFSQAITPQLNFKPQATDGITIAQDVNTHQLTCGGETEGGSTSSISEYLIEMLPGWQVEDLLDSSSDPVGFSKVSDDDDMLFMNANLGSRISSYDSNVLWVPQASTMPQPLPYNPGFTMVNGTEGAKGDVGTKTYKDMMDDVFTVPQISPQTVDFKRFRHAC